MAGQNPDRRDVLQFMAVGAFAARHPGFHKWAFVCQHDAGTRQAGMRGCAESRWR